MTIILNFTFNKKKNLVFDAPHFFITANYSESVRAPKLTYCRAKRKETISDIDLLTESSVKQL